MVSCLQVSLEEGSSFFSVPATGNLLFPASSSTFQKLSTPPGAYEGFGRTACNNLNIVTKKKCPCPQIFCSWQVTRRCLCQRAPQGIGRWAEWTICSSTSLSASSCSASVGREDWFQRWYSTWILIDLGKFGKYHQYALSMLCLFDQRLRRTSEEIFFPRSEEKLLILALVLNNAKGKLRKGRVGRRL